MMKKIFGTIVGGILFLFSLFSIYVALSESALLAPSYLLLSIISGVPAFLILKWSLKSVISSKSDIKMLRICVSCGKQIPTETRYCPHCGVKIPE